MKATNQSFGVIAIATSWWVQKKYEWTSKHINLPNFYTEYAH